MLLSPKLDELTGLLILKLKQLFFKRKTKVPKSRKQQGPPKKRYLVGMNEVRKNVLVNNIKMVIIATNLERVAEEHGIDSVVLQLV